MTTLKEFREWSSKFPEDTILEIGVQQRAGNYESFGPVNYEELKVEDSDTGKGWEFMDFRANTYVKNTEPYFGKCYLRLGDSE